MTTVAARGEGARATTTLERLTGAIPVVTVFVWLTLVYAWQAVLVETPWLFTDELELTQLARSIADSGQPMRRDQEYWFAPLSAILTSPAWLLDGARASYDAMKYIDVVLMTAAIFPAYGLARFVASPRAALFAATGSVCIPAFMYSALLLEEPLAYAWSTLALFLIVRALATRTRRAIVLAAAVALAAPAVRTQLAVLPAIFALSALWLAWTSDAGRQWWRSWSRGDWIGAAALALGIVVVVNEIVSHASFSWLVATRFYKERMLEYGLWAGGAFAIGIGFLPMVAGLAALWPARDEERTRAHVAFVTVLAASIAAFGFYTAVKATYLSTVFATRVAERNLIYLAPLFFAATALWLDRPRVRPVALAVAAAFTALLVATTEVALDYPYFEAPGFSILALANRELALPLDTIKDLLPAAALAAGALLLLPLALRGRRLRGGYLATVAVLVLAWNVTGQLAASDGSRDISERFLENFPDPPNWIDRATGGAPTMYLGQDIVDPTGIWLMEFWNRSLRYVWSLDGTAPGPGPTSTPNVFKPDGTLQQQRGEVKYVLADGGIEVLGTIVARPPSRGGAPGGVRLYEIDYPVRLRRAVDGMFADGWTGESASYSQYSTPAGKPGWVVVDVSRGDWDLTGTVRIVVGKIVIGPDFNARLGEVTATRTGTFGPRPGRRFVIPAPTPPFRVEVRVTPTFKPNELDPRTGDRRALGALVAFSFGTKRPG